MYTNLTDTYKKDPSLITILGNEKTQSRFSLDIPKSKHVT